MTTDHAHAPSMSSSSPRVGRKNAAPVVNHLNAEQKSSRNGTVQHGNISSTMATTATSTTTSSSKNMTSTSTSGVGEFSFVRDELREMVKARDWEQFHTPRNLVLALTGEVGELAEIFQWKGDAKAAPGLPNFSEKEKQNVKDELADVMSYLFRLADLCHHVLSVVF